MSKRRSPGPFTGTISIFCEERGSNIIDLISEIEDERKQFVRSTSENRARRPSVGMLTMDYGSQKIPHPLAEYTPIKSRIPVNANSVRRTKIICAIGPASRSINMLLELLEAGMNVARLNFSHGTHEYHLESLHNLRKAVHLRRSWGFECNCAVLLDTKGPEIRTGFLKEHTPIQLKAGQRLEITNDYTFEGNVDRIACSYEELATSVKPGDTILVADGEIIMTVVESKGEEGIVVVKVKNTAILEERKNMNLPGVTVRLPGITKKDVNDIQNFALVHKVDIVSGSFIRTAANVEALRACLGEKGKHIKVHAKIESVEGLTNCDEIIAAADGIHVSRGDLGMELPVAKIVLAQKLLIHKANIAGKPVVTSTQMLQSMVSRNRPTNAECSDVANAVLDGTDCVMLSAETAKGDFPRESVETMNRIICQAELAINYLNTSRGLAQEVVEKMGKGMDVIEALADASVETAYACEADVLAVVSSTGRLPKLLAKYRPEARILVATAEPLIARQLKVVRGVYPTLVTRALIENDIELWTHVAKISKLNGWIKSSGKVIMVHTALYGGILNQNGIQENDPRLKNVVKVLFVPEKIEDISDLYPTLARGAEYRANSQ